METKPEPEPRLCACGRPCRRGQGNCLNCHKVTARLYTARKRQYVAHLEQEIERLTISHPPTRAAFEKEFPDKFDRFVVVTTCDGALFTGFVVAFLPQLFLKVMDTQGEIKLFKMDQVKPDIKRIAEFRSKRSRNS